MCAVSFQSLSLDPRRSPVLTTPVLFPCFVPLFQRLPNGPSSGLEDSELERQREGEIERQRAELSQLRERLALMCRQVRERTLNQTAAFGHSGAESLCYFTISQNKNLWSQFERDD